MSQWVTDAVHKLAADKQRSADTHLFKVDFPAIGEIDFYFKDESIHPSGSLKHRLARSLFLFGLCNGMIHENTAIVESSSGSTAISEAYFARLLGLRFIAVVPHNTAQKKIEQIQFYGGECHFVEGPDIYSSARALADELGGHYMDQFTYAERATDWRGNNNIAESIYQQLEQEPHKEPHWIVVSAGTGGTSATIGRYIRYMGKNTLLCVADPSFSVFYDYYQSGDQTLTIRESSRIEGIGRPRVEASFVSSVIDHMLKIPDDWALAAMRILSKKIDRKVGGSTGTNFMACLVLAAKMQAAGDKGSIATLICDSGERYLDTYYDENWLINQGMQQACLLHYQTIEAYLESGDALVFLAQLDWLQEPVGLKVVLLRKS